MPQAVSTDLGVINFARTKQSRQRVVAGDDESCDVNEEGTGNVEEDEEEV